MILYTAPLAKYPIPLAVSAEDRIVKATAKLLLKEAGKTTARNKCTQNIGREMQLRRMLSLVLDPSPPKLASPKKSCRTRKGVTA